MLSTPTKFSSKIPLYLAGVFIAGYFLWFTRQGFQSFFTSDDMMNLHAYWITPNVELIKSNIIYFSPYYRPMGALFYKPIYSLAGLNPFPFRLVVHGLFLVNLFLTYSVTRRLAGSREIGLLATFLGAYHLAFGELYYNTGTIYDILCFTFYFSAFLYYVRLRQAGRSLSAGQLAVLCLLYIAALDTKEMAVTLPFSLGIYELLYHRPKPWRAMLRRAWLLGTLLPVWFMGLLTVPYVVGKMRSPALVFPAYGTSFSVHEYLTKLEYYLNEVCLGRFHSLWIFSGMMLVAWILRSRALQFSFTFIVLSMLPIAFVRPRTAFVLYIPMVGVTLYAATLLVRIRELLTASGHRSHRLVRWSPALLFVALAVLFTLMNTLSRSPLNNETVYEQPRVRSYVRQLRKRYAGFAQGTRILLVDDPDWLNAWTPFFIVRLLYQDPELHVDRYESPTEAQFAAYDLVLTSAKGRIVEVRNKIGH